MATSALHDAFYALYASYAGLHNSQDMLYLTATKEDWAIWAGVSHMHEVTGSNPVTPTILKSPVNIGRNDVCGAVIFGGSFGQVLIEVAIDVSALSLGILGTSKAGRWNPSQRLIFFP